jgi:Glycosyltransferases, probably involved in cell wall biogenesis
MDNMSAKVSFIIPALNEEERIAGLIDNIKMLDPALNYEIIVADGNSTDKTVEIAQKNGVKVIKDNKDAPRTIANGRNTGASLASGKIFIFCDADTLIKDPEMFLYEIFGVFQNPEIIGGAPRLRIFPGETILKDKVFHYLFNKIVRFSFNSMVPICGGQCQIVRASSFREVNGYNANIVHGEDSDLFRRLRKKGKLHFFNKHIVYESPRRYRHSGYVLLFIQGVYSLFCQLIFRKNVFKEWRRVDNTLNNKRKSVFI